ncbi:MAG: hypothetical protein WCG20_03710 [bacterium]
MKKLAGICLMACMVFLAQAQEGYTVAIRYVPEQIEILPGLFETFGTITGGKEDGKDAYALSVDSALMSQLVDSVQKGSVQILFGPRLEKLVKNNVIARYQKIRTDLENSLKEEIAASEDAQEKSTLKKKLVLEQRNTKLYMSQLRQITERDKVRAIYVYGRQSSTIINQDPAPIYFPQEIKEELKPEIKQKEPEVKPDPKPEKKPVSGLRQPDE